MTRKLPYWISGYMRLTERRKTTEIFRKWSAISCIAGVLERKVWIRIANMPPMFPNLYVLLVGPSAAGKGVAMWATDRLWRSVEGLHVAPTSVSKASLMDALHDAVREKINPRTMQYETYNSLLVHIRELGMFLPQYDNEFMSALTDIYDGEIYTERKRVGKLSFTIEKTLFNIIAGCTPNYLQHTFPEGAWEQGFASRLIMVFSGETVKLENLFSTPDDVEETEATFQALSQDLKSIDANMFGEFEWEQDAAEAFTKWYDENPHAPTHPRLNTYGGRRYTQLAKLCMVASASRSNDMYIKLEDFDLAWGWLAEAELYMEDVFKAMVTGGEARAMEELYHFVAQRYMRDKKAVHEHLIIKFLTERVSNHAVVRTLELMVRTNRIKQQGVNEIGRPMYVPVFAEKGL